MMPDLQAKHTHDIGGHDAVPFASRRAGLHERVDLPIWLQPLLLLALAQLVNLVCRKQLQSLMLPACLHDIYLRRSALVPPHVSTIANASMI